MKRLIPVVLALCSCATAPRQGAINLGMTPEAVESALGPPDRTYTRITQDRLIEVWAWRDAWPFFAMPPDPMVNAASLSVDGITVMGLRDEERIRVVFQDHKVIAFESRTP